MTRVAVVCGASGGIGSAVVNRLAAEGWDVVAVDRRPQHEAVHSVDVSDEEGGALALSIARAAGRVEAVVNCVGEQLVRPIAHTSTDDWDNVFVQNARTAFVVTKLGVELMAPHKSGSIVHVASVHAQATSPGMATYAASKGAVVSFARAAAIDLAEHGLRVNVVSPGAVDTPMLHRGLEQREGRGGAGLEHLLSRTPLGRIAAPDDVAAAIGFFVDPVRSAFVTGQVLVVDGGVSARLATE